MEIIEFAKDSKFKSDMDVDNAISRQAWLRSIKCTTEVLSHLCHLHHYSRNYRLNTIPPNKWFSQYITHGLLGLVGFVVPPVPPVPLVLEPDNPCPKVAELKLLEVPPAL